MSDGLKFIASALENGSSAALLRVDSELFIGNEVDAFNFVREHHRRYHELPAVATVEQELGVRFPRISEALDFYTDNLYERREYNLIRDHFGGLRAALQSSDLAAAHASIAGMAAARRLHERRGREVMDMSDALQLTLDRLQRTRGYGGISGITTPWPTFDSITGGFQDSDLVTVVARPSVGKTYLLLAAAEQAHLDNSNVLFVTTEMNAEQIARRYASIKLGINPTVLRNNMVSTHTERRLRGLYQSMIGDETFKIFSVGMKSQVSAIEAFIEEFGPSVVYIDGVYLLRPNDAAKNLNRTERITMVYDQLRALTLEAEIPAIVTTQFNRQAGKGGKEGSLENIGYTDAIGTHSSIVLALKYGSDGNPYDSRVMEFLKGREGEAGEVAINFKFAPLDMSELTADQREVQGEENTQNLDWMA